MKYLISILLFSFLGFCQLQAQAHSKKQIAIDYLVANQQKLGLDANDLSQAIVTDEYVSKHNGVTHIYLMQQYEGVSIYNARINFAIDKSGVVRAANGEFFGQLSSNVMSSSNQLSVEDAFDVLCLRVLGSKVEQVNWEHIGDHQWIAQASNISEEPIKAKKVYYALHKHNIVPAWDISIAPKDKNDWWSIRINALTGEILEQNNWTKHCDFGSPKTMEVCMEHHNAIHKIQGDENSLYMPEPLPATFDYLVYAFPTESPSYGERTLVNSPWLLAGDAGTLGWHDDGNTVYSTTRGNNVYAQEDINANDGFGYAPNSPTWEYVYDLDFGIPPAQRRDPAITNLFYVNNMMHDVWYQYGFDEVSGNFQNDNMNRGGTGTDFVIADALDGSGLSNANFTAPPDGDNGRMQMFEWTAGSASLLEITSPAEIAGDYQGTEAAFDPPVPTAPASITGQIVLVDDGTATPTLGCADLENATQVNGKIALIDRGDCLFVEKIQFAQDAGAIAVIVVNNVAGGSISMGAGGGTATFEIPSIMISLEDGELIKSQLAQGVSAKLQKSGQSINIDGDYDNGVVAHEYGHGISLRLTGGPATSDCLFNAEQAGEGWSDWFALMMTMNIGDQGSDSRPMGVYATSQPLNSIGIRNAPYSTDFSINDFTYGDSNNTGVIAEPHGIGFVFCTALWEMTWALIDVYGFDPDLYNGTGGNNLAMQLVIDGLKLQPCNPGMIDSRDAILLADRLINGEDSPNQCIIWEAFAKRGFGYSADQGSSASRTDQVEAFDMPPLCLPTLKITKTAAPNPVAPGEILSYTLTIANDTPDNLAGMTITDDLPAGLDFENNTSTCELSESNGVITISNVTLASGASMSCSFETRVSLTGSTVLLSDDVESGTANWTATHSVGTLNFVVSDQEANSPSNSWFAQNSTPESDMYLKLASPIAITNSNTELRFWHHYNTEASWDGGVVELSINGNIGWLDLGNYMTQNGYNNQITENPASALSGRDAFTGTNQGFEETVIDLSNWEGQSVYIRFRFAADEFVGAEGWYIDDIEILNAQTITNEACITDGADNTACDNVVVLVDEDANNVCNTPSLSIIPPAGFTTPTITLYEGEDIPAFTTTGSSNPSELYFILADAEMNLQAISANGDFDLSTLPLGVYNVYALYYANSNNPSSPLEYLTSLESLSNIITNISAGLCAQLFNANAAGNPIVLQIIISGIEDIHNQLWNIYPNPTNDLIFIDLTEPIQDEFRITFTDLLGRELMSNSYKNGFELTPIDIEFLPTGIYCCIIEINGRKSVKRLTKQ